MKRLNLLTIIFLLVLSVSCSSVDKNFVGSWMFYQLIPNDKSDDQSMNGIVCNIEKYAKTNKTFVLLLFGNELLFSEKDENTLVGQNNSGTIVFDPKTGHITVFLDKDNGIIFSKLE